MDARQLRYFIRIVETQSFTRAAEKLRISQPAIGLQVRKLEEEFGVELLLRHSRGVQPTREGEVLFEKARDIIAEIDGLVQTVKDCAREPQGAVRLGLAPSISLLLADTLMDLVSERFPRVELQLIEATSPLLKQWVSEKSVDIALGCEGGRQATDVIERTLFSESLYLVAANGQFPDEDMVIGFRELENRTILLADPMRTGLIQAKVKAAAEATSSSVRVEGIHPSVETVKLLVEDGKGETLLPWSAIRRERQQGRLTAARVVEPGLCRNVLLFSNETLRSSLARTAVLELIHVAVHGTLKAAPPGAFVYSMELLE